MLTLFTTPVVYLYLDRLNNRLQGKKHSAVAGDLPPQATPGHPPA
jgi:hypothetical protein